jgi:hypothetical protein
MEGYHATGNDRSKTGVEDIGLSIFIQLKPFKPLDGVRYI